ncbi:unnamed protein product, partial [marine sediment metagenome]
YCYESLLADGARQSEHIARRIAKARHALHRANIVFDDVAEAQISPLEELADAAE